MIGQIMSLILGKWGFGKHELSIFNPHSYFFSNISVPFHSAFPFAANKEKLCQTR